MSLTTFIQQKDVRERFNKTFPKPNFPKNKNLPLLAPARTNNYRLIGTAFDYLLRFQIKALNPHANERGWVAHHALRLAKNQSMTRLYEKAYLIITEAKEHYAEFIQTNKMSDKLLRSALLLAKLDAIYRAKKFDQNLDQIEDEDIADIKALFALVNSELFCSPGTILLNPTFGAGSDVVGGADADLIIDDALIEIKTVKEFSLERRDFNQLIGYYVLSQLDTIDNAPTGHQIKRLGIYFSRYGYLYLFDVSEVVKQETFSPFLEWFKQRCGGAALLGR